MAIDVWRRGFFSFGKLSRVSIKFIYNSNNLKKCDRVLFTRRASAGVGLVREMRDHNGRCLMKANDIAKPISRGRTSIRTL